MTVAVGTNIAIVAVKSFFGVLGYVGEVRGNLYDTFVWSLRHRGVLFTGAGLRRRFSERTLKNDLRRLPRSCQRLLYALGPPALNYRVIAST
ncbi:MAG: hypothetical protein R3B54_06105 [Bdellovibrionota bacterium]